MLESRKAQVSDVTMLCKPTWEKKSPLLSSMQRQLPGPQALQCALEVVQYRPPHNSNPGLCLSL